ncbi:MAG TPA: imidazolonepropionase [Solirubrobacteraceae bacterium]|nr:imidazolonepropionase [Solirubrobacteraceae bacterium]
MSDLNVIHASQLARISDLGEPRRGPAQGELDLMADGAVIIRDGMIVAVGDSEELLADWGGDAPVLDATGLTVLPGLIECHSHPLFAGERHAEYAQRLAGASLADIARAGGGIWASVEATRAAGDSELLARVGDAYRRILAGGATTLEVKSGYGLTPAHELHQLELLEQSRALTPMSLVISFLGAHVVPAGTEADAYVAEVLALLPRAIDQGICAFHDITCEDGLFTPAQAGRLFARSRELGIATKAHSDAWASSQGWRTAVAGGAVSAEHLTYTPDEEIREVGETDTIAVLLPHAELVYMTDRRANARLFIDERVPVAVATDYCSSIHATSLAATVGLAAPWFRLTPGEAIVAATLNAAYALQLEADRGSLDPGKRGDLTVLAVGHPDELCLAVGQGVVADVVVAGEVVHGARGARRSHTRIRPFNTKDTYPEQALDNDLSQAVLAGNLVFLRGQVGQDLETFENVGIGDPAAQAHQAMRNVELLLDEAGARVEDICKIVVYLIDIRHREPVYRVLGEHLRGVHPSSTGLVVSALARPEWLVEIDVTAVIPSERA